MIANQYEKRNKPANAKSKELRRLTTTEDFNILLKNIQKLR